MKDSFSVLISVYVKDRPAWVRQALDSVLSNTVPPSEVIIMVDGPVGDELKAVLEQAVQNALVRVIYHPVNVGRGAALAIAVPQCKYELIALVDADDISHPDRFEKQLAAFAANPELAVVGGQVQELEAETLRPFAQRRVPLTNEEIRQYLKKRMPFNNPTVMFKKSAVLASGNFQPVGLVEDYHMWVHVAAKGYQMANLPDILVDMRVNAALYGRRGGYKYFCMNKALYDEMLQLHLINIFEYCYILTVRFTVQVLMPNWLRGWFYRRALRQI